jgi:hypothetical protein
LGIFFVKQHRTGGVEALLRNSVTMNAAREGLTGVVGFTGENREFTGEMKGFSGELGIYLC